MANYTHILVAVDLTDESRLIADKASMLAKQTGARISAIHVIEPINFAYGGDIPMDLTAIQDQLDEHARKKMAEFSQPYLIPEQNQHTVVGLPQNEIHRIAEEEAVDLIVVGSHGRHGLSLLLGSTANGVLHGASCDVLAVRVGQKE